MFAGHRNDWPDLSLQTINTEQHGGPRIITCDFSCHGSCREFKHCRVVQAGACVCGCLASWCGWHGWTLQCAGERKVRLFSVDYVSRLCVASCKACNFEVGNPRCVNRMTIYKVDTCNTPELPGCHPPRIASHGNVLTILVFLINLSASCQIWWTRSRHQTEDTLYIV